MAHAHTHDNVQPGPYGRPFLPHDISDRQILDTLHAAELNMAKVVPWKHGILNNASDDARDAISAQLSEWKHPLDTRRKDDNRVASAKWFTGERFSSFIKGERGSPGGPVAIATLVLIIANDLQHRGVTRGSGVPEEAAAIAPAPAGTRGRGSTRGSASRGGRGRGRAGRGGAAFADRRTTSTAVMVRHPGVDDPDNVATATAAELERVPTRMERDADAADLQIIRDVFGSCAETLINTLLAWDAFMAWYFPLKESVLFLCEMSLREERALDNMQRATDMFEIYERVCMRNSKSFMPHAAVRTRWRETFSPWGTHGQSI